MKYIIKIEYPNKPDCYLQSFTRFTHFTYEIETTEKKKQAKRFDTDESARLIVHSAVKRCVDVDVIITVLPYFKD